MNKKGVSPLIATVLIIGFTVALAAVVIVWAGRFTQQRIEDIDKDSSREVVSGAISINLLSAIINEKNVRVENKGTVPIEKIIVRGNGLTEEIDLSSDPIDPFEIQNIPVPNGNIFSAGSVEVIPGADPDGDGIIDFFVVSKGEQKVTRTAFRVFVTSATYNGGLGGLTGADSNCQTLAVGQELGGTWKAWLSTTAASASSRLHHSIIPYKLVNTIGAIVADDWSDLTDGTLDNQIMFFENGNSYTSGSTDVMTATNIGGLYDPEDCASWTQGSFGSYELGDLTAMDSFWTVDNVQVGSCSGPNRLYCFEQP